MSNVKFIYIFNTRYLMMSLEEISKNCLKEIANWPEHSSCSTVLFRINFCYYNRETMNMRELYV